MATTSKPVTTQKIHSVLRRGGVEKSETYASGRIAGMSHCTEGYKVTKQTKDYGKDADKVLSIKIDYLDSSTKHYRNDEARQKWIATHARKLEEMAALLKAAGVIVENALSYLIIRGDNLTIQSIAPTVEATPAPEPVVALVPECDEDLLLKARKMCYSEAEWEQKVAEAQESAPVEAEAPASPTSYETWAHTPDGERYVVGLRGGEVVTAVGPLHHSEVAQAMGGDFDSDPRLVDAIIDDYDNYVLAAGPTLAEWEEIRLEQEAERAEMERLQSLADEEWRASLYDEPEYPYEDVDTFQVTPPSEDDAWRSCTCDSIASYLGGTGPHHAPACPEYVQPDQEEREQIAQAEALRQQWHERYKQADEQTSCTCGAIREGYKGRGPHHHKYCSWYSQEAKDQETRMLTRESSTLPQLYQQVARSHMGRQYWQQFDRDCEDFAHNEYRG